MKDYQAAILTHHLITWIRTYFNLPENANAKAVIGISGGKDSSVAASVLVKAIGKDRVIGVLMPQGNQKDIQDSYDLCELLDIHHEVINIGNAVDIISEALELALGDLNTVATFNLPARIRMTMLYGVAAQNHGRVVCTCNASEDFVGWATKFGDDAGDFAPLAELLTDEVIAIGEVLGLPERFIYKTPADGLCGQSDEEALGFSYDTVNQLIRTGKVDSDSHTKMNILKRHQTSLHKLQPMPKFYPDLTCLGFMKRTIAIDADAE